MSTQQLLDLTYPTQQSHASTLVSNFISQNNHWTMALLYRYCVSNYSIFMGPDESMKDVFSDACKKYINSLPL